MFSHISGHAMLDLVNTVEWRLSDELRIEDLTAYQHVTQWCVESGVLTQDEKTACDRLAEGDNDAAQAVLQAVIALREATYAALFEHDARAASLIADAYREAIAQADLSETEAGWSWEFSTCGLKTPQYRIAVGLLDLLRRDDLDRLHQCEDHACGWVFLDTSPRRNRRWCVTSDCGDRNRSRAYYARQKARQEQ